MVIYCNAGKFQQMFNYVLLKMSCGFMPTAIHFLSRHARQKLRVCLLIMQLPWNKHGLVP